MKQNHISTKFFNFRLFVEGLKRLRVIGAVTGTIALATALLVPIISWIHLANTYVYSMYDTKIVAEAVPDGVLSIPTGLMVLLAPFFFLTLFSFLRKRKESDFFHAIPYTRTCVYVSFVSAALVFIAAIQIACSVVGGLLWAACPYVVCNIGSLVPYTLLAILAAAMLSAFMMLALTVTGTTGTTMVLFIVFASLTRVICAIWLGMLEEISMIYVNGLWSNSVASPLWYMPISVLYYIIFAQGAVNFPLFNPACILYTLVVTLGLFAFAGFLYARRQSEMAGNPAPGKRTQALFRILFALAPAVLMVCLAVHGMESTTFIILIAITLLCYFLYELCTTKRAKNLAKILPGLGILAGVCVAFGLSFMAYRNVVLNEKIEANDIRSVSFENLYFTGRSYQEVISPNFEISDTEVLGIIARSYDLSQKREVNSRYNPDNLNYQHRTVTIRMKDGRILARRLFIEADQDLPLIYTRINALEDFRKAHYALPPFEEIRVINSSFTIGSENLGFTVPQNKQRELYDLFRAEFETLNDSQKNRVIRLVWKGHPTIDEEEMRDSMRPVLDMSGYASANNLFVGEYFHNSYTITEDLPKTYAFLLGLTCTGHEYNSICRFDDGKQIVETPSVLLDVLLDEPGLEREEWLPQGSYSVNLQLMNLQTAASTEIESKLKLMPNSKEVVDFYTFLRGHLSVVKKPEDYAITENSYIMNLFVQCGESAEQRMVILLKLTGADIDQLSGILNTPLEIFD